MLFILFPVPMVLFSQSVETNRVVFKGVADTAYNGKELVLYNKVTGDHDSATIMDGKFEISVIYKEPTRYMFYSKYELKKKGGYTPFGILISRPGSISIKADMGSFSQSVIEHAPDNELYLAFVKDGMPARQKISEKMNEKFGADVMGALNQKNPKYPEISAYYDVLNDTNNLAEANRLAAFIKLHPDSFVSLYLLSNLSANIPADKTESLYGAIGQSYKNTSYAKNILKGIEAKKITAIGKTAPDFEQPDTSGQIVKLTDFRGGYVLLDFWASWCIPCRAENPNVVKAYRRFHHKGFTVLSVSLDQPGGKEAWIKAISQDQLTWTHVSDLQFWNNAVAKLYGIKSIPQNYLLDRTGKIIAVNIRGDELNKKLLEIFPD